MHGNSVPCTKEGGTLTASWFGLLCDRKRGKLAGDPDVKIDPDFVYFSVDGEKWNEGSLIEPGVIEGTTYIISIPGIVLFPPYEIFKFTRSEANCFRGNGV